MSHRALNQALFKGFTPPSLDYVPSAKDKADAAFALDQDFGSHWEDHETPDCHYCGDVSHTSAMHEVAQDWNTTAEGAMVTRPRRFG